MDTPVALVPPAVDVRMDLVQRVASSSGLQRSPRLRELLLFICERAIQNRTEELREQSIGCGVFGRRPDYSPGDDNIVRVEIRHLRKRLDEYFAGEGKDEPLTIVVPKGTYVPAFLPREVTPATEAPELAPVAVHAARPGWHWASVVLSVVLAVVCVGLWQTNRRLVLQSSGLASAGRAPIWQYLFNDDHQTFIVCADSTLVVAQTLMRHPVTLDQYLAGDYPNLPEAGALAQLLQKWQFTDMTDVRLVQRIYRLNADHWDKVSIRSARSTQIQDFKNGNIVLLGSSRSNPWDTLFEASLNFQFGFEEATRTPLILNRAPAPGEEREYRAARAGESGQAFSTIAFVPNLRHTGNVLIIAGSTGDSTEATGEFLTNPKTSAALVELLKAKNQGRLPYFEALLRSRMSAGVAQNAEIVGVRVLPGEI
jgi:hypothetical protein